MNSKIGTASAEEAEQVAVAILVWLANQEELMQRFLALSGLTALSLRQASTDPGFLAGIVDFVMAHEPTLMAFCEETGTRPERVVASQHTLNGGQADPWM